MADSKTLPPVGSRAIHKDTPMGAGPLWEVYGHQTQFPPGKTQTRVDEVRLKTPKHKVNEGHPHEVRDVPVEDFNRDYKLL